MRQFIVEKAPDSKGLVTVAGKDYRYLRQVLRVKPGDMISLRLPDGSLENSTVCLVDENSKKVILQICAGTDGGTTAVSLASSGASVTRGVQAGQIENSTQLTGKEGVEYWLFQFIPKPVKFEQIVRQAVECGVKHIVPVIGEYSEKSSIQALQNSKKERLERIVREARQQSGSPVNSEVHQPVTLKEAVDLWLENYDASVCSGFVLSERECGDGSIRDVLCKKDKIQRICIACGSEGGISPDEVDFLLKKALFNPVHFSVNILRCETAALYGIAAVQTAV